jgi:hypothetical protein
MWFDKHKGIGISTDPPDVEKIRAELRAMSDADLIKHGQMLARLCDPKKNYHAPPEVWVMQLREARAEWRRRHPKEIGD